MTGLSEQAKELHMMTGRRKPPKIQAVLNTRYWKNTEKTMKRTGGETLHVLGSFHHGSDGKIFIAKVAEVYMLHHTAAILKRNGIDVDVFNIPPEVMSRPDARTNCSACPVSRSFSMLSPESETPDMRISRGIKICYSYTLVPSYIRKKVSSLMRDSGRRPEFSGSLYAYLLGNYLPSEVEKLMMDLPSTDNGRFRRNDTGSEFLKEILGVRAKISELFMRQFSLYFLSVYNDYNAKDVREFIFTPIQDDIPLSEELAHVLFFSLLHSDIKRPFTFSRFLSEMKNACDNNKKREFIREYVSDVTKEYSLCIPSVVSRHDKK